MSEIKRVSKTLEAIMGESEMARHSLEYAQLMVWELQNPYVADILRGIWTRLDLHGMSKPETIRRAWQRIREKHPEYVDDARTRELREEMRKEFEEYARS